MPSDQPRQPQRSWRDGVGKGGPSGGKREWQKAATPGKKAPMSRNTKLAIAGGAIVLVLGLLIVVLQWIKPAKPACLVLIGSGYEENLTLPCNVLGWKAMDDLAAIAPRANPVAGFFGLASAGGLRLHHEPIAVEPGATWDKIWAEVPQNVPERTLVLFLALHGSSDPSDPYLYLNDPRGQTRVTIEQILKSLESPDLKAENKVLILDATQVRANWPTGQLHNDFAYRLEALEGRIAGTPGLVVISASDVDQRSEVSEEWQRSIFAHYIIEGLKGAADRDNTRRVTAWNLFEYVRDNVKPWSRANRDAQQTPVLLGDVDRARRIELVQVEKPYEAPTADQAPGAGGVTLSKDLEASWTRCAKLRGEAPPPYAYAPQLWRRYQETLLRWETLERAGDPSKKAAALKTSAGRLEEQIERAKRLDVSTASLGNALALPAALGIAPPWTEAEIKPFFDELWSARNAEQRTTAWDKISDWGKAKGRDERQARQLLQLELSRLILAEATRKENVAHLEKARDLLKLTRDRLNLPLCAEAHFLVMLLRDMDEKTPPPRDLLQEAVRVHMLAEEAALAVGNGHPYSELVWVKRTRDALNKADEKRRPGEDWLFGSDADAWAKAKANLADARKAYETILIQSKEVRRALAVRDRLMDELPFLALWAAGVEGDTQAATWRERVEALARVRQKIVSDLPYLFMADNFTWPDKLPALIDDAEKQLAALREDFNKNCKALSDVHHQLRYREIENVLAVALIEDVPQRLALVRNSREISGKLNRESTKTAVDEIPASEQEKIAREFARRQGLSLLLTSGDPGDNLLARVKSATPEGWRGTLADSGKKLEKAWLDQRDKAEGAWRESLAAKRLYEAKLHMGQADKESRDLPAGLCATLSGDPFGAAEGMRRLYTADLFQQLARRAIEDHWYADSENPRETFYEPTARAFFKDALRFSEGKSDDADLNLARLKELRGEDEAVKLTGILGPNLPPQYVTTEQKFDVVWNMQADKGNPQGIPMFRLDLTGAVSLAGDKRTTPRRPVVDPLPAKLTFLLDRPQVDAKEEPPWVPKIDQAQAALRGVFRGQRINPALPLRLYTAADTIVYNFPPPDVARVSFRMDEGLAFGAVCIVLDCSGSMWDDLEGTYQRSKQKELPKGERRINLAKKALKEVLDKMPQGTQLSILAFSQKGPTVDTIEFIREPSPWNQGELKQLKGAIDALDPKGETPLVKAMHRAREEGFPKRHLGPKLMFVLSDGGDNYFREGKDGLRDKYGTIPEWLQKDFKNSGIEVNIVCFTNWPEEWRPVRDDFEGVRRLNPPGSFAQLDTPQKLAAALEKAILPRVVLTQGGIPPVGLPEEGVLARRHDNSNAQWTAVKPGEWEASVVLGFRKDQIFKEKNLKLRAGDQMEITLREGDRTGILFERVLFGDKWLANKPKRERESWREVRAPWQATALCNGIFQINSELRQIVALEHRQTTDLNGQLQQRRPGPVWLDVAAKEGKSNGGLRWHFSTDYPAPVLVARQAGWPDAKDSTPSQPDLSMWVFSERKPTESAEVERQPGELLKSAFGGGRQVTVGSSTVRMLSATIEDRWVMTACSGRALAAKREQRSCLVVRVRHDPGKPIWIEPLGLKHSGVERHFHTEAAMSTAIFWGISNPETEAFGLELISIDALKRGQQALRLQLPTPTPNDVGPETPALKGR